MCEQHIDRSCTTCGWSLPLLERRRLREWTIKQKRLARGAGPELRGGSPNPLPMPSTPKSPETGSDGDHPRDAERYVRPWKDVYKDRFKIGSNWKFGRCSIKHFRGHTNGVTCLQFEDNILASGSYDMTVSSSSQLRNVLSCSRLSRGLEALCPSRIPQDEVADLKSHRSRSGT